MTLIYLIASLMVGALLVLPASKIKQSWPKYIALLILILNLLLVYTLCKAPAQNQTWIREINVNWIQALGISFHLAADQLSLIFISLTLITGIIAILITWNSVSQQTGWYYFNILFIIAGVVGIFLAIDMILFYFFWEVMLIPLFLLMLSMGNGDNEKSAYKFFIYTQGSGLLMLLSILALYFIHGQNTGVYTFDYNQLLGTELNIKYANLILAGFLIAFCVKLPVFPVHGWLPNSFTNAPLTAILTGLLIKTGAYGLLRFALPLFPQASESIAPTLLIIGVISAIYGAILAFSQTDIRKIAAYSTISHMGFMLIGIFSINLLAWQGVVMLVLMSALSTGALLIVAHILYQRTQTYDITKFGGLWAVMPNLSGVGLFFVMAMVGLPGLGTFIAEFLILAGAFKANMVITIIASVGVVLSAVYMLRVIQKLFVGQLNYSNKANDLNFREKLVMIILVLALLILGLFPQKVFNKSEPALNKILQTLVIEEKVPEFDKNVTQPNTLNNDSTSNVGSVL